MSYCCSFCFLDLEFETEMHTNAPEPAMYETAYVTSHKGPCRAGAFSPDAQMVATGSYDASIKVREFIFDELFFVRTDVENKTYFLNSLH